MPRRHMLCWQTISPSEWTSSYSRYRRKTLMRCNQGGWLVGLSLMQPTGGMMNRYQSGSRRDLPQASARLKLSHSDLITPPSSRHSTISHTGRWTHQLPARIAPQSLRRMIRVPPNLWRSLLQLWGTHRSSPLVWQMVALWNRTPRFSTQQQQPNNYHITCWTRSLLDSEHSPEVGVGIDHQLLGSCRY